MTFGYQIFLLRGENKSASQTSCSRHDSLPVTVSRLEQTCKGCWQSPGDANTSAELCWHSPPALALPVLQLQEKVQDFVQGFATCCRCKHTQEGHWTRRTYSVSRKHSGMQKAPERSEIWLEKQAFFPMGFRMCPWIHKELSKPLKAITAKAMTSAHPAYTGEHPRHSK